MIASESIIDNHHLGIVVPDDFLDVFETSEKLGDAHNDRGAKIALFDELIVFNQQLCLIVRGVLKGVFEET